MRTELLWPNVLVAEWLGAMRIDAQATIVTRRAFDEKAQPLGVSVIYDKARPASH